MKIFLKILHEIAFVGIIIFVIIHIVRVNFLANIPLASQEAIAIDIRLDRLKLVFSFILSLILICVYFYRKKNNLKQMKPTIYSMAIVLLLSAGSIHNHYKYNKEVQFIDKVYNSGDLQKIKLVAEMYKNNYYKQDFHEFYKISIIEKLEDKINNNK